MLLMISCNLTKYVPENQTLLSNIYIKSDLPEEDSENLKDYLNQTPNNKILGFWHLKLNFYNLSDTSKNRWIDNWLRKIGEPPIIYDSLKTEYSKEELKKVLFNKGYFNSEVTTTTEITKRKAKVTYNIKSNKPYKLRYYLITLPDEKATKLVKKKSHLNPEKGNNFNVDKMNNERMRITKLMRNHGYYNFKKELLHFTVDSALNINEIDVELSLLPQYLENDSALKIIFTQKKIQKVKIITVKDAKLTQLDKLNLDTIIEDNFIYIYDSEDKTFRHKSIINKIRIRPGQTYNERQVDRTYSQLSTLSSVKYINITFNETDNDSLIAQIIITQNKPNTITANLEGTFSGGDWGIGANLGYRNNNIFKGSEILDINVGGGYEAMGKLEKLHSAWTGGGNISLTFPELLIPTKKEIRHTKIGTTSINASYNYQKRPEYDRTISNAGIKYQWNYKRIYFNYNLLDFSYIYLPRMSEDFKDKYMKPTSSIRFSYENNFIMRMGMGIRYSTKKINNPNSSYYNIRTNLSIAGNFLYGMSHLFQQPKNQDGAYEIFNIRYAQYAKLDFDYSYNHYVNKYCRLVFHSALGVAIPYGNATILPFEERFYSGGAYNMRGWSARTLGPGNFHNNNGSIDFMKQSGDIRLDLNFEARFKLFWKLHAALFVDAGNIWTIRDYKEQPEGQFLWNKFYKQIGCNYGIGLRADFDFFVIRVDFGIKLYDPGYPIESERWRTELTWRNDYAFHVAVGYPF